MNFDTVTSMRLDGNTLVFETMSGQQSVPYPTAAAAGAALRTVTLATGSAIPGNAALVSIAPNSVAANADATLLITGTDLLPSASVVIGGYTILPGNLQYLNGTSIQIQWLNFTLTAGTYSVVYTDAAGGSSTLVGAFTIT